ncbi:asparaginase [Rhodococcoides corynebacterioides]|uniref:asparaginase n=1 Tax=Rhodococcoides corynebacterioides TaxID=53972 RepID=A0ABS7P5I8_9NOCA|nr:asparaginase [Rhodococcus corynebacterioides]MBY6366456.1 asparaginase [Rhodococcus corynebacterioides]MBY6407056.1 asparaginase [Rhodococcus corynebacterioides]
MTGSPLASVPSVVVLTTGGTIASRVGSDGVSTPGKVAVDLDAIGARLGVHVTVVDVLRVDSAAMSNADLDTVSAAVAQHLRSDVVGVVVLHGTDTLEETAMLVDLVHDDPRPVVFTGAQRTADHPDGDGPHNAELAVAVAADPERRDQGVLVAFGPRVLRARGVRKAHTTDLDAYTGLDADVPHPRPTVSRHPIEAVRVDIVALHPGVDGVMIDAACDHGAAGIVLEAMGAGNANVDVVAAVRRAVDAGVAVVLSTRVPSGGVVTTYGGGGGGADLVAAGALSAGTASPAQARITLCALVAESPYDVPARFAAVMDTASSVATVPPRTSVRIRA